MPRTRLARQGGTYPVFFTEYKVNGVYAPPILDNIFSSEGINLSTPVRNRLARQLEEIDYSRKNTDETPTKAESINRLKSIIDKAGKCLETHEDDKKHQKLAEAILGELEGLHVCIKHELGLMISDDVQFFLNDVEMLIKDCEVAIYNIKQDNTERPNKFDQDSIKCIADVYNSSKPEGRKAGVSYMPTNPIDERYYGPFFRIVRGIFDELHIPYTSNESLGKMIQRAIHDL